MDSKRNRSSKCSKTIRRSPALPPPRARPPGAYDREDLFSYDVVVLYDSPGNLTDAQKAKFLALFDKGIGVVVLHHACLS